MNNYVLNGLRYGIGHQFKSFVIVKSIIWGRTSIAFSSPCLNTLTFDLVQKKPLLALKKQNYHCLNLILDTNMTIWTRSLHANKHKPLHTHESHDWTIYPQLHMCIQWPDTRPQKCSIFIHYVTVITHALQQPTKTKTIPEIHVRC